VIGLSWAVSFVLGAVVSPTDPLAATSIARRFGVPRRAIAIVEGESLVNDGTALVLFKFAAAAVVTGSFSLIHAAGDFVWSSAIVPSNCRQVNFSSCRAVSSTGR